MACDPYRSSVVLALHMDGTNGSTTFTDSSPSAKTVTASGNAQISTTQSKFGGASAYFDGTGDYLTVASSADFAIISGNFTVEFFAYFASSAGNQAFVEFYADTNNRWNIGLVGNIQFYSAVGGGGSAKITATAPSNNAWHHVALVKSGSTFTLYVDGSSVGTSTTTSYHTTNSSLSIGWAGGGGGSTYTGYIDDLRITKGVARYTANFTAPTAAYPDNQCVISGVVGSPGNYLERVVRAYRRDTGALVGQAQSNPTTGAYSISAQHDGECFAIVHDSTAFDPHWGSVVLASHMDGTNGSTYFKDETGKTVTVNGNAQISTAQSKFGGASAYFDGSGDYASVASSTDFQFGTGDFTAELWVRRPALTTGNLLDVRPVGGGTGAYWAIYFPSTTEISLYASGADRIRTTHGMVVDTWYHIAVCRASGTTRLFLNGTQLGSNYTDATSYLVAPVVLCASAHTLTDSFLNSYIDDLRITKGVARYTANFTAPTAAFVGGIEGGTNNAIIYDRVIPA